MSEHADISPGPSDVRGHQTPIPQDPYGEEGCGSSYPSPEYYGHLEGDGADRWIVRGQTRPRSNGVGMAGFILAMASLALLPFPLASLCAGIPALVLSVIGVGRRPRRYAVTGVVMAVAGLALVFGGVGGGLPF